MDSVYAKFSASISEFKKNPTALLNKSEGSPIVILNHNKPTAYLVPASFYQEMLEKIEDKEMINLAHERLAEKKHAIAVSLDEL